MAAKADKKEFLLRWLLPKKKELSVAFVLANAGSPHGGTSKEDDWI